MKKKSVFLIGYLLFCLLFCQSIRAQTTEFTYQGSLMNGGSAANGNFDFEFALFDVSSGGNPIATILVVNVPVVNGIFSVKLNFGNQFQTGAARFLEIRVRPAGQPGLTTLSPRQLLTSAPYAVKSLTAETVSNVNAANITSGTLSVNRGGTGLTSPGPAGRFLRSDGTNWTSSLLSPTDIPPGSANYIQNGLSQQANSSFNISGNGTIGNNLTVGGTGDANMFRANFFNVGSSTILRDSPGVNNFFVGAASGNSALTGQFNTGLGPFTGLNVTNGSFNSFFGTQAGVSVTSGSSNSFFGSESGEATTTGGANTFLGQQTGLANITGSFITLVGVRANVGSSELINATAIGARAFVTQSNSLILGSIDGINNASSDTNVGIGTTAPQSKLEVRNGEITSSGLSGGRFAANNPNNQNARVLFDWFNDGTNDFPRIRYGGSGEGATNGFLIQGPGDSTKLTILNNGNVGINTTTPNTRLHVSGTITTSYASGGAFNICRNADFEISVCSSSIRYKENISPFTTGLSLIRRLRPVSFNWKTGGTLDFGLVAEEVAEIEPLLITRNDKGEIEGVKYDRLGVVLLNAVREQQTEIEAQQKQLGEQNEVIKKQQAEIEILKSKLSELEQLKQLVCAQNPTAELCQPKKK